MVNGEKTYITNGVRAHFLVTAVQTRQQGGLQHQLPDRRPPGGSRRPSSKSSAGASDTATVAFDDVFVPEENLLGAEHEGFKLIMASTSGAPDHGPRRRRRHAGRGRSHAHLRARAPRAFGRPLTGHQAIRHKLVDLATTVHTCRVTHDALQRFHAGEEPVREVTMAKLVTQRAAFGVMDACLQIHGGAGYMREYEIERMARDARLSPIGGAPTRSCARSWARPGHLSGRRSGRRSRTHA